MLNRPEKSKVSSLRSQPVIRSSTTAEGGLECWKPGTYPEGVGLRTAERVQRIMECWPALGRLKFYRVLKSKGRGVEEQKRMQNERLTFNLEYPTSNPVGGFHSMLDVGSSMFDVQSFRLFDL